MEMKQNIIHALSNDELYFTIYALIEKFNQYSKMREGIMDYSAEEIIDGVTLKFRKNYMMITHLDNNIIEYYTTSIHPTMSSTIGNFSSLSVNYSPSFKFFNIVPYQYTDSCSEDDLMYFCDTELESDESHHFQQSVIESCIDVETARNAIIRMKNLPLSGRLSRVVINHVCTFDYVLDVLKLLARK